MAAPTVDPEYSASRIEAQVKASGRVLAPHRLPALVTRRMLAGLAGAVLAFSAAATPAFATLPPAGPDGAAVVPAPSTHSIVIGGMAGWQIALIAVGAALLPAVLAVIAHRMRPARRRVTASVA